MKLKSISRPLRSGLAASLFITLGSAPLFAANLFWDADTTTTGIQEGNGNWTSTTAQFAPNVTPFTAVIPVKGTDGINFGNGAGAAGFTVTVNEALNYSDTTSNSAVSFNRSYTLSGTGSLAAGNVGVNNASTVNIAIPLSDGTSAGQKTWNVSSGSTLTLTGGGDIQNLSGTGGQINFQTGTFTTPGSTIGSNSQGLTVNVSNNAVINAGRLDTGTSQNNNLSRTDLTITNATVNVAADSTIGSAAGTAGVAAAIGNASVTVNAGGTLNTNAIKFLVGGGGNTTNGNRFGSNGVLTIDGGTYVQTATSGNAKIFLATNESNLGATSSTLNITNGGVATTAGVQFGDNAIARDFSAGSTSTVNVTNSTLNLGSGGININGSQDADLTRTVNLSSAKLAVATGNTGGWTIGTATASGIAVNLTGTNEIATNDGANARAVIFNTTTAGTGGLLKTGVGTLTLNGVNNYTGNTTVNAGNLTLGTTGVMTFAIGASGVNNFINGTGAINLNGSFTFNLALAAAAGTWNIVDVANLTEAYAAGFAVNGFTETAPNSNVWTFTNGSGSTYTYTEATGVLTAIPEPGALLLGGLTLIGLATRRNRRSL